MRRIKSFLDGSKSFGTIITNIINTVLLLIIYFVGIGLAALIVRITKQELMNISNKRKHSYYKNELTEKGNLEEYYKQF